MSGRYKWLLRKIPEVLSTLFLFSILAFFAVRAMPGDPAGASVGMEAGRDAYLQLREMMELDLPIWQQYVTWLSSMVRLDFGTSLLTAEPINEVIWRRLFVSIELAALSFAAAACLTWLLVWVSTRWRGSTADSIARLVTVLGLSVPVFWSATLLLLLLSLQFTWSPPFLYEHLWENPIAHLQQMGIAALVLAPSIAGQLTRILRTSMEEEMVQDYVLGAQSRGSSWNHVIRKHVTRNALLPTITFLGTMTSVAVGGVVVTETIFSIPGVGLYLMQGVRNTDYPVVQAVLVVSVVAVMIVNILVDLSYAYLNPKVVLGGDGR